MKPDPDHAETLALRRYVETVADLLGVEPGACWSECDNPSAAYIALADRSARHPGRLLMLQWSSEAGWSLALEPEGHEEPAMLASWPDPVRPRPAQLVHHIRPALDALRAPRERGGSDVCAH